MRLTFIATFLLFNSIAAAQASHKQLRFNHLFLKDGLIEAQVYQMEQDNEGYIWFGTRTGLVRFDGYTPKTYQLATRIISRSNISAIYKDKKGGLWIAAAYEGLFYYDRAKDTFIHCQADIANERRLQSSIIRAIQDDANGNLWLNILNKTNYVLGEKDAYESLMLYNANSQRFTNFSNIEKDTHRVKYKKYFSPLVTDNKGNTWCGSDSGLYEYDQKSSSFKAAFADNSINNLDITQVAINPARPELIWLLTKDQLLEYNTLRKEIKLRSSLNGEDITQLSFDSQNHIWVAGSKGLSFFDDKANRFINYKSGSIAQFEDDLSGGFWCRTFKGLLYFDKRTGRYNEYLPDGDPAGLFGYPNLIFVDINGTLWITVVSSGIQWINKQSSSIVKHELPGNMLFSIDAVAESADSTFWLVTKGGLYHWIPATNTFINITLKDGLKGGFGSVFAGSNNNIWLGGSGENNGVFCYNTATRKLTNYKFNANDTTSVSGPGVAALLEDKKGNIWIGTWGGGLCMLDVATRKIKRYPFIVNFEKTPNGNKLDDKDALRLYQDKTGVMWVGTNSGSLNRFEEKSQSFVSYQNTSNLFRCIVSITEDKRNRLWAATYAAGLFLFDREKEAVRNISTKDGLLSDNSGGLVIDDEDNIWLNSAKGLSIYNPASGQIRGITYDIVQSTSTPFCSFKTMQGEFIFPVSGGFAMINPRDFAIDSTTPIVHIESIKFNKPRSKNTSTDSTIVRNGKNKIDLKYDENRITFCYVGLIYQNVEQVRYRYRLEGYDNSWVNANTQRTVTYTNLAPGTYTFHVIAANSDGVWSKKDDSITIIIAPPFWQTWWFRSLVVLTTISLVFLIIKLYLNAKLRAQQQEFEKVKAIEKVRTKISMDIHDEISSGLTRISMLSQRIKAKFEKGKVVEPEIIDKIAGSSKEVINNLGEIIWAVNPKHDNLQSLLEYIRNYAANFFESTPMQINIHFPDDVPPVRISPDIKHNVFLIIKEALNNIVKHSAATEANLLFSCTGDYYTFIIRDNGKGISDLNGRTFGNGFINMKNRMNAIGGTFIIESAKGEGTTVKIEGVLGS